MAEGSVQLPPDSNGSKVRTEVVTIGGSSVHQQVTTPAKSDGTLADPTLFALDGTDGTSPPSVLGSGTGIRGWLRSIYEKLTGTVAVTQSGTWTVQPGNTVNSTPWKTDDDATQTLLAGGLPAALAAGGGLKVEGVAGGVAQPVSSTTLATAAKQPALGTAGSASTDVISVQGIASMTALKVDGSGVTQPVSGTVTPALLTTGTGTKSSVASSGSSVTVLASNGSRKGATFYNDSTQILYLDLSGGTASASSYSVQVPANGFFCLDTQPIYTGAVTGIWASANGNARVTEFS